MIEFDEKFFEGEERDGFYVEGEMKRVWAAQMEVLMEIDRICKKHNIPYFADSGTLLGAVRHNGYIPWDDDMDIAMLRSDYMKFISIAPEELTDSMICVDIYHMEEWTEPFARVVNGKGTDLTKEHMERYHSCPYCVGVDIFILDNLPATEEEYQVIVILRDWVLNIKQLLENKEKELKKIESSTIRAEVEEAWNTQIEEQLKEMEERCKVTIDREKNIPNQLLKITDGLLAMYGDEESSEVTNLTFAKAENYHGTGRKKAWYRESRLLPFENIMIPVPIEFKKAVEKTYGLNYLTPVKKWHYHDYPYYKEEKRRLDKHRRDVKKLKEKRAELEKILE